MTYLFVYGTLKSGFVNNDFLRGCACHGTFEIDGVKMYDLGGAPALVTNCVPYDAKARASKARGEIWEVDANTLRSIDRLEGHPSLYERQEICWWNKSPTLTVRLEAYIYKGKIVAAPVVTDWKRSTPL